MSAQDIAQILDYHNRVRAEVGVEPLVWSAALADFAGKWALQLAETGCAMRHRDNSLYGENLYIATAGAYDVVDAGKAWAREKPLYDGGVLTPSNWRPAGHYTQMVWRRTERLGCARSRCGTDMIVVCNYDPPGNYIGRKPY